MTSEEWLSLLLTRWHEARDQGDDLSAEELCRDHPELSDELGRRIRDLEGFERMARAMDAPTLVLAGYRVVREIGRGGMGVVFEAEDLRLKRRVAIKRMRTDHGVTPEMVARFHAEAEAVARLHHPHIVHIYQAGDHEGHPYIVLELITGGSLEPGIHGRPQPVGESARLVMLLARAVHAAHAHGVIHRDLKPANVLLAPPASEPALNTAWGCPKVSDFGLARLGDGGDARGSRSGLILGTPAYMAPEQAESGRRPLAPARTSGPSASCSTNCSRAGRLSRAKQR